MPRRIVTRDLSDKLQLKITFSEALRKQLVASAESAGRSMTAEIVHRLEHSFKQRLAQFEEEADPRTRQVAEAFIEKAFEFLAEVEEMAIINRLRDKETVPEIVGSMVKAMADWDDEQRRQQEQLRKQLSDKLAGKDFGVRLPGTDHPPTKKGKT